MVRRNHLLRLPLYHRSAQRRVRALARRAFPPAEGTSKRGRKLKLKLDLPKFEMPANPDMARPTRKHPRLQSFAELVQSIPKEGPVEDRARRLVDVIQQSGIKAVAADFDLTILTVHTGGGWPEERLSELRAMSPDFISVAKELNRRNIPLHIVTFSDPSDNIPYLNRIGGEMLVREVLRVNEEPFAVDSIVAMRPDLYTEAGSYKALGLDSPPPRSKAYHIETVAGRSNISVEEVLLIDDDRINCTQQYKEGGLALHVTGQGFSLNNIVPVTSSSLLV